MYICSVAVVPFRPKRTKERSITGGAVFFVLLSGHGSSSSAACCAVVRSLSGFVRFRCFFFQLLLPEHANYSSTTKESKSFPMYYCCLSDSSHVFSPTQSPANSDNYYGGETWHQKLQGAAQREGGFARPRPQPLVQNESRPLELVSVHDHVACNVCPQASASGRPLTSPRWGRE